MIDKKPTKNYIENDVLYQQIVDWKLNYDKCLLETEMKLPISEELAGSILLIAQRTATRYNFAGYQFRDDMIMDAVYVAIKYTANYDLTKTNPHAYYTTTCFNAFINRINIEKKNAVKKYKYYINEVQTNSSVIINESGADIDHDILNQMTERVSVYEANVKKEKSNKLKGPDLLSFINPEEYLNDDTEE